MFLQFLIVDEENTSTAQRRSVLFDDDEEEATDPDVIETWNVIAERWGLKRPQLVISVVYDIEQFFMNKRVLKSIVDDLVKTSSAEGK